MGKCFYGKKSNMKKAVEGYKQGFKETIPTDEKSLYF